MTPLFDVRIDGHEIDRLRGKPAPGAFLEAARRLVVEPTALSSSRMHWQVSAPGMRGRFGLVIGLDKRNQPEALRQQGADVVVLDLSELLPGNSDSSSPPR